MPDTCAPSNDLAQHLDCHGARPEHRRRVAGEVEHRRLDADGGRAAIENEIDPAVEILDDVRSLRWAWAREEVSAAATGTAAASINARATGCAGTRTATLGRPAVTSSGTWAERGRSASTVPARSAARGSGHSSERVRRAAQSTRTIPRARSVGRSPDAAWREQPLYRRTVEGIHPQPVYGLGRKRDQAARHSAARAMAADRGCPARPE